MKPEVPLSSGSVAAQWTLQRTGPVVLASFANGGHGYMNDQTEVELEQILDTVEADKSVRCVVITGSHPTVFIRHYDVSVLVERGENLQARGKTFDITRPVPASRYLRLLDRIEAMPVAFIAAINGVAMGGGLELALACDIRIAIAGDYPIGLPEINIGLLPGAGGTQRLPRLIGEGRALELTLFGKTLTPTQALAMGLISEIVAADLTGRAMELASELSGKHPKALAWIKKLIRASSHLPVEEGQAHERTLFCDLMVDQQSLDLMRGLVAGRYEIQDRRSMHDKYQQPHHAS
jgi:enoyl-CoA hydratase/carnithine racemase